MQWICSPHTGIRITTESMKIVRDLLSTHFEKLKPLPGTRSFHHFSPINENCIQVKRYSVQRAFDLSHNLSNDSNINLSFKPNQYIACMYNGHWLIRVIVTFDNFNGDLDMSFIDPHDPTRLFSWPKQENRCLLPFKHVLYCISTLCTVTGQQYNLMDKDTKLILESLSNFKQGCWNIK